MTAVAITRSTVDEYLALERTRPFKSEFYRGEVYAMTGGSAAHSLIASNIIRRVGLQLEQRPCRVYTSDMRVRCPTGLYTYPDASAVCGEPELEGACADTLLNPVVIFEVLSESTEAYDRGKKFEHYATIATLRDYVLVPQDRAIVQRFSRQDSSLPWTVSIVHGLEASLEIPSLDVVVSLNEVFAKVVVTSGEPGKPFRA